MGRFRVLRVFRNHETIQPGNDAFFRIHVFERWHGVLGHDGLTVPDHARIGFPFQVGHTWGVGVEGAHRGHQLGQLLIGSLDLLRVGAVAGVTQHPQPHVEHFTHVVGEHYAAFKALVPQIGPGGHLALNIGGVHGQAGGAPQVWHAVLVVRVDIQVHQFRIQVIEAVDLAAVDRHQQVFLAHLADVVRGRHGQIVRGAVIKQFQAGIHGLVAVVSGIDHLDTGFLGESVQHFLGHVFRPVVQVQDFRFL